MTREEIKTKVIEIVASKMDFLQVEISESTSFKSDLGTDSLDDIELLMEFEKVFGIEIPDEETIRVVTVSDVINGLAKKLGAEHLCDSKKMVSEKELPEDLEEAAEEYEINHRFVKNGFIAGAEWQKAKMMEDAVEARAYIAESFPPDCSYVGLTTDEPPYISGLNEGDKVKIIIVKEGKK